MPRHLLAALLITGLSASACRGTEPAAAASTPPVDHGTDVAAVTVAVTDVESTLQISGNLAPQARVAILSKLPGTLSRVAVDIGDQVRAGQVVAELDAREIEAQVDAAAAAVNVAEAGLEAAEAALANAVLEHDRARNLFERGALPRQRLDGAETTRRAAAAQRDLAKATLAQTEASMRRAREVRRDATLTAPVDGVIVERNYDPGSLVSSGDKPVVVVADLRVLTLEAGVSELDAGRLRAGMSARVTVQARGSEVFDGRIAAIAPEVDPRNRHFRIEVRMSNRGGVLLSGMYATATIPLVRAVQAVAVPREAVTTRDGKRVALRIDGNNVTEVPVTEGVSDGRLVHIAAGLQPGDVVVSDARQAVAPGSKVNPIFVK
jgi:RND family efflux transporter MFP subunit